MSYIAWYSGVVEPQIIHLLCSIPDQKAWPFLMHTKSKLESVGFKVRINVRVKNRGDGKRGFIDIVASREKEVIALELDRVKARKKSIFKVKHYPATARIVVCRKYPT